MDFEISCLLLGQKLRLSGKLLNVQISEVAKKFIFGRSIFNFLKSNFKIFEIDRSDFRNLKFTFCSSTFQIFRINEIDLVARISEKLFLKIHKSF